MHNIPLSTVEILLINKALRLDMQNDLDNEIALSLIDKLNNAVVKDMKKKKVVDLTNKCGSCKWARPRHGTYIDCTCPSKKPNFFARTTRACKKYEKEKNK